MAPKKDDKKNAPAAVASSFLKREPIEPPPLPADEDIEDPFKIPRDLFMAPFPEWDADVVDTEPWNPTADEENLYCDTYFVRKCLPRSFQSKVSMWKRCESVFDNEKKKDDPEKHRERMAPPSTPPAADPKAKAKADPKAKAAPSPVNAGPVTKVQFEGVARPGPGMHCVVDKSEIETRQFELSVDDGCSPLCQALCSQMILVGEHAKFIPQGQFLWDLIYPQDENGVPLYNPSGKYCVKLFVQGAWRQVTVDDVVPVAQQAVQPDGRYIAHHVPLLPWNAGNRLAIWPLILSKAILKAFQADLKQGMLPVITCLTGWLPLRLPFTWDALSYYHGRSLISSLIIDSQVDTEARQNAAFAEASAALQSQESKGEGGKKAKVPELKLNKGRAQQPSPKLQRASGAPYEATLQFAIVEIESDPPQLRVKSSTSRPAGGNPKKTRPMTEGEDEEGGEDEDEEGSPNDEEHEEHDEENEDEDDEEHRSARSPAGNENPSSARSQGGGEGEEGQEQSATEGEGGEEGSAPASAKSSPWPETAPIPSQLPLSAIKEFQEKLVGGFWLNFDQVAELIESFEVYVPKEAFVTSGPLETSWADRAEPFSVAHPKLLQVKLVPSASAEAAPVEGEECPPLYPTVFAYEPLRPDPALEKVPGPGAASVSCAVQSVSHWQREPAVDSGPPFINFSTGDGSNNGAMAITSMQLPAGDHWYLVVDDAIRAGSTLNVWTDSSQLDTESSVLRFIEPTELLEQYGIPAFTPFEGPDKAYSPQKGYGIWAKAELVLGPNVQGENFQLFSYLSDPSVQPHLQLSFLQLVMQGGGAEVEQSQQTANWSVKCLARSALLPLMTLPLGDPVDTSDGTTVKYVLVLEANLPRVIKEGTIGLQMIMPSLGNVAPQEGEEGDEAPVTCTPLKTETITRWSQDIAPHEKGLVLRERIAVPAGGGEVTAALRISVKNLPHTFLNAEVIVQLPPTQEMRPRAEGAAEPEPFKIGDNVEPKEYGGRKNWLASLRTVVSETGVEAVVLPHVVFMEGVTYIISVSVDPFRGPNVLASTTEEPATWLVEAFGSGEIELGADTMEQDLELLVRASWAEKEADRAGRAKASRAKWVQENSGQPGEEAAPQEKTEEEQAEEQALQGALERADYSKHLTTGIKDFVYAHTEEAPVLDVQEAPKAFGYKPGTDIMLAFTPLTDVELANRQDAQDAEVQAAADEWEKLHAEVSKAQEGNTEDLEKLQTWGDEQPWGVMQCGEKRDVLREHLLKRKEQRSALRAVIYDGSTDLATLQEAWDAAVAAEVNIADPDIGQRAENKLKILKNVGKLEDHLAKKDAEDPAAAERYLDDASVRKEVTDLLTSANEMLKALAARDIPLPEGLDATLARVSEALEDGGQAG